MNYEVKVGTQETTEFPEFFDITSVVNKETIFHKYQKVFIGKFSSKQNKKFGVN